MSEVAEAVSVLAAGGVIGLPTETVYGLAADGLNPAAVARIFAIKGRPTAHPLILHLADASELDRYAREVPERARRLAAAFWPGPLTLILERSALVPDAVTGGRSTVALRVPGHPVALEVLRRFGGPLAAPSANRFGSVSPTTRAHVLADLGDDVPVVLEGGACEVGLESTIVDLSRGAPRILRPGRVGSLDIERVLGEAVLGDDGDGPAAPGTLESHYAPRARVVLCEASEVVERARASTEAKVGLLVDDACQVPSEARLVVRRVGGTAASAAHELYAALRELDEAGVGVIFAEHSFGGGRARTGLDLAIEDRLQRAAAGR